MGCLFNGPFNEGDSKEKVGSLLLGIFFNLLLILSLSLFRLDVTPEHERLMVNFAKRETEMSSAPSAKNESSHSVSEIAIRYGSISFSSPNLNFAIPELIEHKAIENLNGTNGITGSEIFEHRQSAGEGHSLFDKKANGSGENLGVVLDVSVSMARHAESVEQFLTENFPDSLVLHSQDSSFKNSSSAVIAITKMARMPGIDSILFICDLKDIYNQRGNDAVEQAMLGGPRAIRLYVITMHSPPSRPLRRLVRATGGQIYDYSDDFDLTWRTESTQSLSSSANEAFVPSVSLGQ